MKERRHWQFSPIPQKPVHRCLSISQDSGCRPISTIISLVHPSFTASSAHLATYLITFFLNQDFLNDFLCNLVPNYSPLYLSRMTDGTVHCMEGKSRLSTTLPCTQILVLPYLSCGLGQAILYLCLTLLICAMRIIIILTSEGYCEDYTEQIF